MKVQCNETYSLENCDLNSIARLTVEDYERCAPAELPVPVRNYYLGWSGRGVTYRENRRAYGRINIRPKMLQDVSNNNLDITVMGQKVSFPVGISPTAFHMLANPEGENATARAAAAMNTIMIVSSYATIRLEKIADSVNGMNAHLWMQLYIFRNRSKTVDIVRRAEKNGYKALVLTVDSDISPPVLCNAKFDPAIINTRPVNVDGATTDGNEFAVISLNDIRWLKSITKLPIVAKGILTGDDATRVILAGASAVLVSNHGGRQLDTVPASIGALPDVIKSVNRMFPRREVYLDSGIRNGFDVYKALARGAKMVFIGRPALWGLTLGGEEGVMKVLSILKDEFNSTMLLAGASNPGKIRSDSLLPVISDLTI